MKTTAVLLAGCLPLAAVTAWSFVEMVHSAPMHRGPETQEGPGPDESGLCEPRVQSAAQARQAALLTGGDLLSGGPADGPADLPDSSPLKPLQLAWARWREAMETARAVAEAAQPAAPGDPDALKQAAARLESLKAQLEASPLPKRDAVQAAIARRLEELKARIVRVQRGREAAERLGRAQAAFASRDYGACAAACDELLTAYPDAMDPEAAGRAGLLRARARFWDESTRVNAELEKTDSLAERRLALQRFLARHPDRALLGAAEQEALGRFERDLTAAAARLDSEEKDRAAQEALAGLRAELPADFAERARQAARIIDRYPTEGARAAARREALAWLAEFLPEKQLQEPPEMQEVETARHEIVRGFFTEVGSPKGYKCYPTYEQSVKPVADVGTYLAKELLGGPAPTVPRRCVARFEKGRAALLAEPARKERWRELADLCAKLDEELAQYRAKPGASRETLSFSREAAFLRSQLSDPSWTTVEKLFRPPTTPNPES